MIKFSIVTPTHNAERYLEQTISSVLSQQGNFDIEYVIIDKESTDKTLKIVENYLARMDRINSDRQSGRVFLSVVSNNDRNMYEAINRGFAMASGNVFAWINADDLYLPGAFDQIARALVALPEVKWLKGITAYIDEESRVLSSGKCYLYAQSLIKRGLYGREAYFIQQDSVFWRADLWRASGGLNASFRLAGDYDLWVRFAERAPLYSVNFPISCFRKVRGQLSENLAVYREEQQQVPRGSNVKAALLGRFFSLVEPRLPIWLSCLVFRAICPFDPLYLVEVNCEPAKIRKSFKYVI